MQSKLQSDYPFDLSGGNLALDYANTISWRGNPARRKERLESYFDLIAFAVQDRVLLPKQANELRSYGQAHGRETARSLRKAITLREAIYCSFAAIVQSKAVPADDLRIINDWALEALRHRQLARANGGYRWEWQADQKDPVNRILWPIAEAAAALLISDQLKIVRWCEAPDCQWLFLDHSRNRSRRWCDMSVCGNRAKARRHYQRTRE